MNWVISGASPGLQDRTRLPWVNVAIRQLSCVYSIPALCMLWAAWSLLLSGYWRETCCRPRTSSWLQQICWQTHGLPFQTRTFRCSSNVWWAHFVKLFVNNFIGVVKNERLSPSWELSGFWPLDRRELPDKMKQMKARQWHKTYHSG